MLGHTLLLGLFAALLEEFRHQCRPAGLVAGPNARAVVAMEVLIEQQQITPVRILLELLRAAVDRPAAAAVA